MRISARSPGKIRLTARVSVPSRAPIQTVPELTSTANALIYVHSNCPPVLMVHGSVDGTVSFNQSELLNAALTGIGADTTFLPNYGADHGVGEVELRHRLLAGRDLDHQRRDLRGDRMDSQRFARRVGLRGRARALVGELGRVRAELCRSHGRMASARSHRPTVEGEIDATTPRPTASAANSV